MDEGNLSEGPAGGNGREPDARREPDAILDSAHNLGRRARRYGVPRDEQPLYVPGSPEATAWLEGWDVETEPASAHAESDKRRRSRRKPAEPHPLV
jgi:hypothetical protein